MSGAHHVLKGWRLRQPVSGARIVCYRCSLPGLAGRAGVACDMPVACRDAGAGEARMPTGCTHQGRFCTASGAGHVSKRWRLRQPVSGARIVCYRCSLPGLAGRAGVACDMPVACRDAGAGEARMPTGCTHQGRFCTASGAGHVSKRWRLRQPVSGARIVCYRCSLPGLAGFTNYRREATSEATIDSVRVQSPLCSLS